MRIAIVINTSWNIYNFRLGLVRSLLERGHEIFAVAPKDDYSDLLVKEGCKHIHVDIDSQGVNPWKDLKLTYRFFLIYKKIQPDVILQYTIKPNIYGSMAAWILKFPAINNVSGLGTVFLKKNLLSKVSLLLYKTSFKFPKIVFFQNEDDRALFLDKDLVKKKITRLVPGSGIDLKSFPMIPYKRNSVFTFLVVSRIIKDKGILEYINAIKILREKKQINVRFQLLGPKDPEHKRGIPLKEIDEWIENGLVEYLGTTDDVKSFIQKADCVVLPSYREGAPRTLLEAASLGRPIITSNVPGCRDVVKDGFNGLLCEVKNDADLADKMQRMYSMTENELIRMSENGRKKIEDSYDERIVINLYLQAIRDVVH
ncbi:glycosyltransferase family 4 protein [Fulvivirgaceae bacterium BMA10]|uniref:Glycosyltransferase family 4 protein n=1 Tax=Splendidivirga corallicola TaxID=3051826 RepID=A0ABT8KU30_9BACT|nr:glycosyltransferase family 4 protein [Fulvivirgaceae bacterium BMA10]